ncbi:MAG: hypothetical protein IKO32_09935 [Lachnospiraceae bacterium]|nr:hypothetical protein [Lachnospiraceae bacterium]
MKEFFKKIEPFLPIPLIGIFLWVYYLCNVKLGVYANDDILYATNLVTGESLKNFSDIVQSQIWHYFNWGGRTVAHTILQITFLLGDTFINIFNPFACLAFAAVCNLFFKKKNLWTLLAALSGIFALNTIWYETQLWQTGIANYLYLAIIYLPVVYFYIREAEKDVPSGKAFDIIMIPVMAVLGLFSGWSNENMGAAIFIGMVTCIILVIKDRKKCPAWMIVGALSALIGCAFLVLAPGNYSRADEALEQSSITGIKMVINRLYTDLFAFFVYLSHMVPVFLASVVMYKGILHAKWQKGDFILMGIPALALAAMIMTPHFPHRAVFGICAFLLVITIRLIEREKEHIPDAIRKIAVIILWAAGIFRMLLYYFE